MKLSICQIQFLDFLLKRIQSKENNFLNSNEKLSLVIDINGTLWTGDFVNYSDSKIQNVSLNNDGNLDITEIEFTPIVTHSNHEFFKGFISNCVNNINKSNLYLLSNKLLEILNKVDCSNLKSNSIIFNAENLNSGCKLPFMHIDNNIKYDFVSLIVLNKN
ncbi:MAG: hypothetical protein NSGCLCUN01_03964 [uncultured Clostridium sp.]